jgi:hypothetical protein
MAQYPQGIFQTLTWLVKQVKILLWKTRPYPYYKVYTALISQTGTADPIVIVLQNELSGTIIWTRSSVGVYLGTLAGVFTSDKTTIFTTVNGTAGSVYPTALIAGRTNSNEIFLLSNLTNSTGTPTDSMLAKTPIEIRIYN